MKGLSNDCGLGGGSQMSLFANYPYNVEIKPPTNLSSSYILTLPDSPGTTGQVLTTDGTGNLSWTAGGGGGGGGGISFIGMSVPSWLTVSPTSLTANGTFTLGGNPTGTGQLVLSTSPTINTSLKLSNNANIVTVKPANPSTTHDFTLPGVIGDAGQVLRTDGSGNSYWATGGGGTVTSVSLGAVPGFLAVTSGAVSSSGSLSLDYSGTALPTANGGTGSTTATGTGANVLATAPTLLNTLTINPSGLGSALNITKSGLALGNTLALTIGETTSLATYLGYYHNTDANFSQVRIGLANANPFIIGQLSETTSWPVDNLNGTAGRISMANVRVKSLALKSGADTSGPLVQKSVNLKAPSSAISADYDFILPTDVGTAGYVLTSNGAGAGTYWSVAGGGGGGSGTVSSVGLTVPAQFAVSSSPITTAGTINLSFTTTPAGSGKFVLQNDPIFTGLVTLTAGEVVQANSGTGTVHTIRNSTSNRACFTAYNNSDSARSGYVGLDNIGLFNYWPGHLAVVSSSGVDVVLAPNGGSTALRCTGTLNTFYQPIVVPTSIKLGTITMKPGIGATTYDLNLPTAPGAAGQVLTSGGAGANMTWGDAGTAGTVNSVGMLTPVGLTVTGSPITTAGILAVSYTEGTPTGTGKFVLQNAPTLTGSLDISASSVLNNLNAGMEDNSFLNINSGKATSTGNSLALRYFHLANGNAGNKVVLGVTGQPALEIMASGETKANVFTASSSVTTPAMTVNGAFTANNTVPTVKQSVSATSTYQAFHNTGSNKKGFIGLDGYGYYNISGAGTMLLATDNDSDIVFAQNVSIKFRIGSTLNTSISPLKIGNYILPSVVGTAGQVLVSTGADSTLAWQSLGTGGGGSGTVTSVGMSAPAQFSITGSPVTSTGTLALTYASTPTGTGKFVLDDKPTIQKRLNLYTSTIGDSSLLAIGNFTNNFGYIGIDGDGYSNTFANHFVIGTNDNDLILAPHGISFAAIRITSTLVKVGRPLDVLRDDNTNYIRVGKTGATFDSALLSYNHISDGNSLNSGALGFSGYANIIKFNEHIGVFPTGVTTGSTTVQNLKVNAKFVVGQDTSPFNSALLSYNHISDGNSLNSGALGVSGYENIIKFNEHIDAFPTGVTTGSTTVQNLKVNAKFVVPAIKLGSITLKPGTGATTYDLNLPTGPGTAGQVLTSGGAGANTTWVVPVTSVGLSAPAQFSITGSPVTSTGTLALTYASTPTGTGKFVLDELPTIQRRLNISTSAAGDSSYIAIKNLANNFGYIGIDGVGYSNTFANHFVIGTNNNDLVLAPHGINFAAIRITNTLVKVGRPLDVLRDESSNYIRVGKNTSPFNSTLLSYAHESDGNSLNVGKLGMSGYDNIVLFNENQNTFPATAAQGSVRVKRLKVDDSIVTTPSSVSGVLEFTSPWPQNTPTTVKNWTFPRQSGYQFDYDNATGRFTNNLGRTVVCMYSMCFGRNFQGTITMEWLLNGGVLARHDFEADGTYSRTASWTFIVGPGHEFWCQLTQTSAFGENFLPVDTKMNLTIIN